MLPLIPVSCESKSNKPAVAKAARIDVQVSGHYNEKGFLMTKLWSSEDKVAAFCPGGNETAVASPISSGSDKSLFTFSLNGLSNGSDIVLYWPADADIKAEGTSVITTIPSVQNGVFSKTPVRIGQTSYKESSYMGAEAKLTTLPCTFIANVQMGSYSITKAVLKGNAGEKLSGTVKADPKTLVCQGSETTVTVELPEALDCRNDAVKIAFLCCPATLASGYTVTFTTDKGEEFSISSDEMTVLRPGELFNSGSASDSKSTQIICCGDNMIYILDAKMALENGWRNAIVWEWNAKNAASQMGKNEADMIRLDECKPVYDKTKILATSSKGYAVLVDKETKELLWFSTISPNAHSAEILPGGRIAVACSGEKGSVQIFDDSTPDKLLFSTPLSSAHGVVWNDITKRLYAIGGSSLKIYSLAKWDSIQPELVLESTLSTSPHVTGLHDLSFIDSNTLLVAGAKAALFTIEQSSFEGLDLFNGAKSLKSVNYNKSTGECWYTDSTEPEGDFDWSTQTIQYSPNATGSGAGKKIKIDGLNLYKVRVLNW